jgi:hypothetical protein
VDLEGQGHHALAGLTERGSSKRKTQKVGGKWGKILI